MKYLEKTIKYGIYLALILPLVFTSRTMQPWHFGKTVLFQALVEILLALALVYFSFNKERKIARLNLLDWLVLLFLGLQFVAAILGVNFNRSFWGNQTRAQGVFTYWHFGVFYLLLRQFFTAKKDWQNLGIWILIISSISSLLAWFGRYFSFFDGIIDKGSRLSGMIGNPIFFAAYLIIPAFLGLALFFSFDKNNKWRYPVFLIRFLNLATLFFTQIRGAFIGLMGGIFIVALAYLLLGKHKKAKKIIIAAGVLFLILSAGLYILNQKTPYLENNVPVVARLLDMDLKTTTANTRLMAWEIALKGWRDKPVFGWGTENFQDVFDKHYNPEFLKYSLAETVWDKPHNYPLEVLATMGSVGFFSYLGIIAVLMLYLIKTTVRQENEKKKLVFIILIGAAAAYIGQSSFGIETSNSLQIWFWLLAFISFCYGSAENESNFYGRNVLYKSIGWLALIFIIVAPFLIYKNYSFFRASVLMGDVSDAADISSLYLWRTKAPEVLRAKVPFLWEQAIFLTQDLSQFDGRGILNKDTLEPVASQLADIFEGQIKSYPTSYVMRFWAGQLYGFMGEFIDNRYFARSEEIFKEAWNINKGRQNVPLMLAKNYLIAGQNQEGIKILEELTANNPEFEEPHWFLGLALMQDGQKERGRQELEKGKDFGINFSKGNILYLIDVYAEVKDYEKIIPLYELLIAREPENPQYYASLAVAYAGIGNDEEVVANLSKAVELQPELAPEAEKFLKEQGIDINKFKN
ncbi:MAG: O-antigen ligase family protein [Patescibacteria group bacterium]|nr:O-antigen ligase family protein [Patescibacteria group bacterium]